MNPLLRLLLLTALFVGGAVRAQDAAGAATADSVQKAIAELRSKKDDADPQLITHLANAGTREAAVGLVNVLPSMSTLLMRREVLRAMCACVEQRDGGSAVVQKLGEIAGNDGEMELRELCVKGLGRGAAGKDVLKQLVDGPVDDHIRTLAIAEHRKYATAADAEWYRFLWNLKDEQRKDADGNIMPPELPAIREQAFAQLAPTATEDELIEVLRRDQEPKIRRLALKTMRDREMPKTEDMAQWVFERVDFPGTDRAEAARILVDKQGSKIVPTMLALAKKRDVTPEDLRAQMATLIANMRDEATMKKCAGLLGKGKTHEKVFALQCCANNKDPKVVAAIKKSLKDKELEVVNMAAEVLAKSGDREVIADLRELLARSPAEQRIAIDAISAMERGTKWLTELSSYATNTDREVRNAALSHIAEAASRKFMPVLESALQHEDWSTRLIAIDGLLALREKSAVPLLIERLALETGRTSHRIQDALWRLTVQPWADDVEAWRGWWKDAGDKFTVATEADFDKAEKAKEMKRLTQRTVSTAKFFGIKIESTRVIFIIDCSGSMLETLYGHRTGKRAPARIDVAKAELQQAIKNLEPNAEFNIYAFSNGVEPWRKNGMGHNDEADRASALEWVERLGAAGGTNLYDSMEQAFADKDVDTIFVMSDGEPTVGQVIDMHRIREDIARWNEHRQIKINTIAVGGTLDILEWLAKDSGGVHKQLR